MEVLVGGHVAVVDPDLPRTVPVDRGGAVARDGGPGICTISVAVIVEVTVEVAVAVIIQPVTGNFDCPGIHVELVVITVTTDKKGNKADPSCFWCAWKRREALFKYCVRNGYNRLALGHHSDDVAETTLLNLVYHGHLETMLPRRSFFDGKFDLIRPLFFVHERELARLAKIAEFKVSKCICANADESKRQMMKKIVRELYSEARQLHPNLWSAAEKWWEAFGDHPLHSKSNAAKSHIPDEENDTPAS